MEMNGEESGSREEGEELEELLETIEIAFRCEFLNKAYAALSPLLERDLGIELTGRLTRKYLTLPRLKRFMADIYGRGVREGKEVIVLGAYELRPTKKDVQRLVRRAERLSQAEGVEAIPFFVAHSFRPAIQAYLKELGVKYYWSYELDV